MILAKTSKPDSHADVTGTPRPDLADLWDGDDDEHSAWLANKRQDIAIVLTGLLHEKKLSRAHLARTLGWKPSRVSRALSGRENLTLNTLAEIIGAAGQDFDILIRERGEVRAFQPWEHTKVGDRLLDLHTAFCEHVDQAKDCCEEAKAILRSAAALNRSLFRQGHQRPKSERPMVFVANDNTLDDFSRTENNDARVARQA